MGRYQVIAEDIRLMEEKLQSLKNSISEEKYEYISRRIDEIKRLGLDLPDRFDDSKVKEVLEQVVFLQFDEFWPEFVEESTKEIKRVAFLQKLQYLLNRVEENEDVRTELEAEEQYWASIESYYDALEALDIRKKLDEIRLASTLKRIQNSKAVNMGDIDVKQNSFLIREHLQRVAEDVGTSEEDRILINAWLGESIDIKSGKIDGKAMERIVSNPMLWEILSGERKGKSKASKGVVEQKKSGEESEERKQEITALCEKYKLNESNVRELLEKSKDDVWIIKGLFSYKAVEAEATKKADKIMAIIYDNTKIKVSGLRTIFYASSMKVNVQDIILPDNAEEIEEIAFFHAPLLKVRLPDKLKKIGLMAFYETGLESLETPNSLEEIGDGAFYGCRSLSLVKLSDNIRKIGRNSFACTGLESLDLPDSLEELGVHAFGACGYLRRLKIGTGLETIPLSAFEDCGLESVDIPGNVKKIEESAFAGNYMKKVTFHEGLETIANGAFMKNHLNSVVLPISVKRMEKISFDQWAQIRQADLSHKLTDDTVRRNTDLEELKQQKNELEDMLAKINEQLKGRDTNRGIQK